MLTDLWLFSWSGRVCEPTHREQASSRLHKISPIHFDIHLALELELGNQSVDGAVHLLFSADNNIRRKRSATGLSTIFPFTATTPRPCASAWSKASTIAVASLSSAWLGANE